MTTRECVPDRSTLVLAATLNTIAVVLQPAEFAVQVATVVYAELLSVPVLCDALVQTSSESQEMAEAAHVAARATGGVKLAAFASSEIWNCLVLVARAMLVIVTL